MRVDAAGVTLADVALTQIVVDSDRVTRLRVAVTAPIATMTAVVTTGGHVDHTVPDETAPVVAPGHAAALRAGVERLLADDALAGRLIDRARARYAGRTREDHRRQIQALVENAAASRPWAAGAAREPVATGQSSRLPSRPAALSARYRGRRRG